MSDSPRILLCGPSVRAFAQSAAKAGYRVVAVDDFGDLDLAEVAEEVHPSPADADRYEKLFREVRPDAWCYGGGWENKPALVERLSRIAPLWGNGAETLRVLRDPFRWTAELRKRRFETPELRAFEDLPAALAEERAGGRRWLSKRFDGANGGHVRWANEVDGEEASGEGRYLQEFVEGELQSASFVSYRGGLGFLGACRQIVGAKELGASAFGFAGAVGPLSLSREETEFLIELGDAIALACAPIHGLFGVDGVRTPDGRWLPIEINPRYAASMETLDQGREIPIFARHAAACTNSQLGRRRGDRTGCLAKGILYAKQELSLAFDLPAWRGFESELPGVRLADLPRPGTISRVGDPILTLLVAGNDVDEAQAALLAIAPRVYEELARRFGCPPRRRCT